MTSSCAAIAAIALAKATRGDAFRLPINPHLLPTPRRRPASGMPDTRTSSPRSTNSSVRNVSEAEWQDPQASRDASASTTRSAGVAAGWVAPLDGPGSRILVA